MRQVFRGSPEGNPGAAVLYQQGVRLGALGLLLNSVVLGATSLVIGRACAEIGTHRLWGFGAAALAVCMGSTAIITVLARSVPPPKT